VAGLDPDAFRALLAERLAELSIPADAAALDRLTAHARLLDEWSARMNLVGLKDRGRWVDELYADSARLLPVLAAVPGPAVDLGSGAGFPGLVPAALEPHRAWLLVDSHAKKHLFQAAAVRAMGLDNVSTLRVRAEDFGRGRKRRETFAVAVFKALAPWPAGLEMSLPAVRVGGIVAFFAGKDPPEPAALARVAGKLGGGTARVEPYRLPDAEHPRHIVTVQKIAPTPAQFPRRVGDPRKRPLERIKD
jgi:16S rRNA (guanine527-N7)-methyltransferase